MIRVITICHMTKDILGLVEGYCYGNIIVLLNLNTNVLLLLIVLQYILLQ